jgi:hypothetical protein
MTEGRQPFTAEIKTLAKGPSTYDPLENDIRKLRTFAEDLPNRSNRPEGDLQGRPLRTGGKRKKAVFG